MTVAIATLRQDVFSAIRALIIANKPYYTFNGATYTYTVVAEYPNKDSTFPCVVINKGNVEDMRITLDAQTGEQTIEIIMDFYAKEAHGKKAIDVGQDGVYNAFLGNIPAFISTNGIVPTDDFWSDSGNSIFEDKNQLINTASSVARFKLS